MSSHDTTGVSSSSSSPGTALKRTFSSGHTSHNNHSNSEDYNNFSRSSSPPSYTTSPATSVFKMSSSNSNNEQQIPLMAGSDEQGHALGQSGSNSGKADHRLVGMGENDDSTGMGNRSVSAGASKAGGGMITMPETAPQHPAFPIASYCVSSIVMTVVNKFVLSGRHFTMNFLFLCIQSTVCVVCVLAAKRAGSISVRDFDPENARKWFPISFLLVCVIYTGSKALQYLTIPVYTIFKNLTIILIAYGEVLWFGSSVTGVTLVSFGLMVLSSMIAAYDDIARFMYGSSAAPLLAAAGAVPKGNSPAGYLWMFVNCLVSAGYVLGMRKRIKTFNFKDWDSMYYNNLLSIPVLIIFSLLFEGWSYETFSMNFPEEGRFRLMFAMFFSGLVTVFISYTTAWCVRVTSSTTYSMVGALNKLPVAASGLIFFGDPVTFGSVSAIFTGFVAGLVYAIAKQSQAAQLKKGPNGIELGSKPR